MKCTRCTRKKGSVLFILLSVILLVRESNIRHDRACIDNILYRYRCSYTKYIAICTDCTVIVTVGRTKMSQLAIYKITVFKLHDIVKLYLKLMSTAQLVTVERVVFDTMGQMWGTLLINCMTALCSLVGIAGVCIHEKIAIGMVSL